jgi:uncharacterized protein involved in exopolysaccharide biosynthesis
MLREAHVVDYDAPESGGEGVPLPLRVGAFISANRRTIVRAALALSVLAAVATALTPRKYEATVAFTPSSDSRQNLGAVAGLASQLGLQIDLGTRGENLAFYAALIESRELLQRAVTSTYKVKRDDGAVREGNLIELLNVKGASPAVRRNRAVKRLDGLLTVRSNPQANIIEVKVATRWPELSEQIANRVLVLVNEFNLERRQSQAAAERKFVQSRVDTATSNLQASEEALADFIARNRVYANSPELSIRYDRLRRRVDLNQQVLTSLVQNLERARIEEVRNTPVVTPIDLPTGSAMPKPRGMVINVFLGLFFGAFLGAGIAALRQMRASAREHYPEIYAKAGKGQVGADQRVGAL